MRSRYVTLIPAFLLMFCVETLAKEPTQRFRVVADRMVTAINERDYRRIQQDFGEVMLDAFPLSKSKLFFRDLTAKYGKIQKLGPARLHSPEQAIIPAQFERTMLDIKLVLDGSDKIIGLWFLPHTPDIPIPDAHTTRLKLPFTGKWIVLWGGDTKALNQHHDVPNQKYAFDFVRVDTNGKTYRNDGRNNEDYYAFGKPVIAPADGIVTDVIRGVRDNKPGSMNPYSALGNAVIIEHRKHEASVLAHFRNGSIKVNAGDTVTKGQVLGLCGNSGNSSEPHIHYHIQNTPVIQNGTGIKCTFSDIVVSRDDKTNLQKAYSPIKNDIVQNR